MEHLVSIIDNAESQRPSGSRCIDSATAEALLQVTGDFKHTLGDCERLLSDNSQFKRNAANFIDNVKWHSSTERNVNHLRQRVHFHQTKVNFIAKPFEHRLLIGIERQLRDLKEEVAGIRGISIDTGGASPNVGKREDTSGVYLAIPEDVETRLNEALLTNPPASFHNQQDLPLKEGFNAVIFHFEKSAVNSIPAADLRRPKIDPLQFLNLLKSRWILERLSKSVNLHSAGLGSLWAECMRDLELQIQDQLSRFESGKLDSPSWADLSQLPDSCFSIWIDDEPKTPSLTLTDEQPLEEKILELELDSQYPSRHSTITIFRKSDVNFQLVSTTKDERNKYTERESVMINMAHTRLIPTYAVSENSDETTHSLLLCQDHSEPRCHTLLDAKSVREFQRALLGYRVSQDMIHIKWCIEFQSICKRGISGNGRLQFWQPKPLAKNAPDSTHQPTSSEGSSSSRDAYSPLRSESPRKLQQSVLSKSSRSVIESRVSGSSGDGIAILRPELPVLVIFTECDDKYNFLHLKCMVR